MEPKKPMLAKRYQLKAVSAVIASLMLSACGSAPERAPIPISLRQADSYKVNCKSQEEQIIFLEQQLESTRDRVSRSVVMRKLEYLKDWC
jgi:hypothetical protein